MANITQKNKVFSEQLLIFLLKFLPCVESESIHNIGACISRKVISAPIYEQNYLCTVVEKNSDLSPAHFNSTAIYSVNSILLKFSLKFKKI